MKIVKAELDDKLHAEFKVWSYQSGVTMAQALVGLIETGISKKAVSGRARMNSDVAGKSERDGQMEESPPEKVNPPTCQHQWIVRNGKTECQFCRERPK